MNPKNVVQETKLNDYDGSELDYYRAKLARNSDARSIGSTMEKKSNAVTSRRLVPRLGAKSPEISKYQN